MTKNELVTMLVLVATCGTACSTSKAQTVTVPAAISPAAATATAVRPTPDEYVTVVGRGTDELDLGAKPGIIEGMVEVRFVTDKSGTIATLPSGRPLIRHEDIMLNMARTNLQQNYARFMSGTVAEGVSVATSQFLRNYLSEPEVKSFQEDITRIAYRQTLPPLRETEQVVRGNMLIVRADVREQARDLANQAADEALQDAFRRGAVDRDKAMEFLNNTLKEMGL